MKKTAAFFLIIFSLVQAVPVIYPPFGKTLHVLVADEQKADENSGTEEKKKEDFATTSFLFGNLEETTVSVHSLTEGIQLSPFTENLTPPPDRC